MVSSGDPAGFAQEGELSAAIALRRPFPGITDKAKARACPAVVGHHAARRAVSTSRRHAIRVCQPSVLFLIG